MPHQQPGSSQAVSGGFQGKVGRAGAWRRKVCVRHNRSLQFQTLVPCNVSSLGYYGEEIPKNCSFSMLIRTGYGEGNIFVYNTVVLPRLSPSHKVDQSSKSQEIIQNTAQKVPVQWGTTTTCVVITLFSFAEGSQERGQLSMNTIGTSETSPGLLSTPVCGTGKQFLNFIPNSSLHQQQCHQSTRSCAAQLGVQQPNTLPQHITMHNSNFERTSRGAPLNTTSTRVHHGHLQLSSFS